MMIDKKIIDVMFYDLLFYDLLFYDQIYHKTSIIKLYSFNTKPLFIQYKFQSHVINL